jgi:hypothetical protein
MQSTLTQLFQRITAHDAQLQRARVAEQTALQVATAPPKPQPVKRPVGRPKRTLTANEVLAAAATSTQCLSATEQAEPQKRQRGSYTHWFASDHIHHILQTHKATGHSARRTLSVLQRVAPDRYAALSHTTISSWFDKNHKLLPQYQRQLDDGVALGTGGTGRHPILARAPEAEAEIKTTLLQLRTAGAPVNCHVIRWVMHAILQERCPAVLDELQLSHAFISAWARKQLNWRWRARTTAASKLPADWETQGVNMAMRVAAKIQMHKVMQHYACTCAAQL